MRKIGITAAIWFFFFNILFGPIMAAAKNVTITNSPGFESTELFLKPFKPLGESIQN